MCVCERERFSLGFFWGFFFFCKKCYLLNCPNCFLPEWQKDLLILLYIDLCMVCAAEASNNPITGVSKPGNILCILSFSGFGQLFGAAGR